MEEIDISTNQLCEQVAKSLPARLTFDTVLAVWHAVGTVVKTQMSQKRGVRLDKLGMFTFSRSGAPIFNVAQDFSALYRVDQVATPAMDNISSNKLNLTQLQQIANVDRATADKVYNKFVQTIGKCAQSGRSVLVSFSKVGEVMISARTVSYSFMGDFQQAVSGGAAPRSGLPPKVGLRATTRPASGGGLRAGVQSREAGWNAKGYVADDPRVAKRAELQARKLAKNEELLSRPRPRDPMLDGEGAVAGPPKVKMPRNPIFGDASDQDEEEAKFSRRPQSARSNMDLMASPRSRTGGSDAGMGSRGGLTVAQLRGHDARTVAASAMGDEEIITRMRERIIARGGSTGIRGVAKVLAIMDDNGDKRLSKDEIKFGLRDYGVTLTPTELEQLFRAMDRDGNGFVDMTEFLVALKGEMNPRRKALVKMAFDILDRDGSGEITVDELVGVYDVSKVPAVVQGSKTTEEALMDFMSQWDRTDADGIVTLDEFEDYYKEISASIDDDEYFELMIRNAWRMAGGVGQAANTANLRVLVTDQNGRQYVETVNDELGMKPGDRDAIKARLARQGVNATNIDTKGGVDSPRGGAKKSVARPPPARLSVRDAPPARRAPTPTGAPPRPTFGGGDESLPPRPPCHGGAWDPNGTLKTLLYTPPCNIEMLGQKLAVSVAQENPRTFKAGVLRRLSSLDSSLSKAQLNAVWALLDPSGKGFVDLGALHSVLANKFGRDKSFKSTSIFDRVVAKILERCGSAGGIKGLQRTLAIMDDNGDKRLSKDELKFGLQDYGVTLNVREVDDIFGMFDRNKDGFVDVSEFLIAIRGDLNPRRKALVRMAFDIVDRDGSGEITVDDLVGVYDVSKAPAVIAGKQTEEEALGDFMSQWDRNDVDGIVTLDEFEDYYKELSASIDGDDYFELMIRNAWRMAGGVGQAANTANLRVLVTDQNGRQYVETVNDELGMKPGDRDAIKARLARQGVNATNIDTKGGVDSPRGGAKRGGGIAAMVKPPLATRHMAAAKLAAAYRGKAARKKVEGRRRIVQAQEDEAELDRIDAARPQPAKKVRPKGKSYIGF